MTIEVNTQRLREAAQEAMNMGLDVDDPNEVGSVLEAFDVGGYEDVGDYWQGNVVTFMDSGAVEDEDHPEDVSAADPFLPGDEITVKRDDGFVVDMYLSRVIQRNSFGEATHLMGESITSGADYLVELRSIDFAPGFVFRAKHIDRVFG